MRIVIEGQMLNAAAKQNMEKKKEKKKKEKKGD